MPDTLSHISRSITHPHPKPRCSTYLSHPRRRAVPELHLSLPPPLHREEEVGGRVLRGVLDPADYLVTLNITTLPYTSLLLLITVQVVLEVLLLGEYIGFLLVKYQVAPNIFLEPTTISCSPTCNLANHYYYFKNGNNQEDPYISPSTLLLGTSSR